MSEPDIIRADAPGETRSPPKRGFGHGLLRRLFRTPVRTFLIYPVVVIAFELYRHDGTLTVVPWGAVLLLWGFLQYRIIRSYRWRHGGGGPGLEAPPQRIVTEGPYNLTRNPMYLGHLIFLAGLALTFWSWLAIAILLVTIVWYQFRVLGDEKRLVRQFGAPYQDYCSRVKRWIPGLI
jgi:protein-S-isoprenylcysteine O-methyltransferase Ste14